MTKCSWFGRFIGLGSAVVTALVVACSAGNQSDQSDRSRYNDAQDRPDSGSITPTNDSGLSLRDAGSGCTSLECDVAVDAPPGFCGNSSVDADEECDDGNSVPGDGCSGLCRVEPNYACPTPGAACVSTIVCGDSRVEGGEACEDGNTVGGDGCSAYCQVEFGYACVAPGQACIFVGEGVCGDGQVNFGETCDDRNAAPGDGCDDNCRLEAGYSCPDPGEPCSLIERCGDGSLGSNEQCDDQNQLPGDGCTGTCLIEPYYECPVAGSPCTSTIVCGDLEVIGDEACDDGNSAAGDGCSADCKQVEAGFTCPRASGVGGSCTPVAADVCGDGRLSYGEYCDDGNADSGDGCSSSCIVEAGYTCASAGQACTQIGWCGDGKLSVASGEQCDDANAEGGDGCSASCLIEADYICPEPGSACIYTVRCGDRKVTGSETCDDGNLVSSDGCSANCRLETGWSCPAGGVCTPKCGDALLVSKEQCDDGNTTSGDGCSSTCQLQTPAPTEKDAWQCLTPGAPCTRTNCGNAIREGSEQCDDGDNDMGDGCTPFCRKEPSCPVSGGACTSVCGDGMLLPIDEQNGQECDDGNNVSGDGCSATCAVERGYACTDTPLTQNPLILPAVYRDFRRYSLTSGHPDFEQYNSRDGEAGIVTPMLGTTNGGKPIHVAIDKQLTTNHNTGVTTDYFGMWYTDTPAYNRTLLGTLPFTRLASGVYQYANETFFPIDGLGWGNDGASHNFHFTSEVRYWFEYRGGEELNFYGDDDVFVFVNKRLAVDIGGIHYPLLGTLALHASNGTGSVCDVQNGVTSRSTTCSTLRSVSLGLTLGSVYEIVVFQAERHTTASRYRLTLSNFSATRSVCNSVCGDALVTPNEACDLGTAGNTGAYNTCNPNCTLPARCGDAIVQTSEQCDDGVNLTTYGGTAKKCAPNCTFASYCGDGKIDGTNGEACDDGINNGRGYGYCSANCQIGPRCGDGLITDSEQCDDAIYNGTSGSDCQTNCMLKCGNGTLDAGEQCDSGVANNTGGYGKCNADCTWGPRCGDGIKNGSEQCDDGKNDGSYGACARGCVLGPHCGDGIVQSAAGEICDQGSLNADTYGKGKCTTLCRPAPYCGDKSVDVRWSEQCDDAINNGQPGSCETDCSDFVPLTSCGDGIVQAPELCDQGAANGTTSSNCDSHCKWKCGNGFKDSGEQCDNGVNDGSYGTCKADCTLAGYCGDGTKNGVEQCDLGGANETNPYGSGKCTTSCLIAPYCGDSRIQSSFGEECDSTGGCDATCKFSVR